MTTEYRGEHGQGYGIEFEVTRQIIDCQSQFQHIELFETANYGRLLILDGIIQLLEFDEFVYHEMLVNLAIMNHPAPRRALVVGGGDGGAIRELCRHQELEEIHLCEIDPMVTEVARKELPNLTCTFDDPRLTVYHEDANTFIERYSDYYDVIVIDSTDPVDFAEPLFGTEFYSKVYRALTSDGVVSAQSESVYLFPEIVKNLRKVQTEVFGHSTYAMFYVPSYPMGNIGAALSCRNQRDLTIPLRTAGSELTSAWRYYTSEMHQAACTLPPFVQQILNSK